MQGDLHDRILKKDIFAHFKWVLPLAGVLVAVFEMSIQAHDLTPVAEACLALTGYRK